MNLEHTADENPAIDRNFNKLKAEVIDTGGLSLSLRRGSGNVTFPGGSPFTNVVTVTHGLSAAPGQIIVTSSNTNTNVAYSNVTATTFDVSGQTVDGSSPGAGNVAFSWMVIT